MNFSIASVECPTVNTVPADREAGAALYALLATGIGFAVLVYSSRYLPLHLEHEGRPPSDGTAFYFFLLLFMGSMVGLAMAQDLILVFVFWDLTAIASYLLIGFDRQHREARLAALEGGAGAVAVWGAGAKGAIGRLDLK